MLKLHLISCILFLSQLSFSTEKPEEFIPSDISKEFTGILKYIEYTPFDTTYYTVFVTKEKIRVDFYNNDGNSGADKIMIYNLKDQNILALKPADKIFKYIDGHKDVKTDIDGCQIIPNKRIYKYINNYKCVQYRVRNTIENTDITYWIPEESFPFYSEMISMKHSMQRSHKYFFMLPNYKVAFPMETIERTLLREKKSSFKVIEFSEETIDHKVFDIPEDYIQNE